MTRKIRSKSNVRIEGNIENEIYLTTRVDPTTVFKPSPGPKNSPIWPRKAPNNSKISSTLREMIEGNIESRNCYCIRIDYDDDNEEEEEEN